MFLLAMLLAADVVLASGGDLPGPPEKTIERGVEVAAYGFAEVPGRSRLQAALAVADAGARAELVKAVRVTISESFKDRQTATTQEIEQRTTEVAKALLPAMGTPRRGWRKLKRGEETVLQVWSRVSVPAARLKELTAR